MQKSIVVGLMMHMHISISADQTCLALLMLCMLILNVSSLLLQTVPATSKDTVHSSSMQISGAPPAGDDLIPIFALKVSHLCLL